VAYLTQPQHEHIHRRMVCRNMEVMNVIVRVRGTFDSSCINAIFHDDGGKWGARDDGLADNHVTPGQRPAVRADADLDSMHMHRAIVATLDIILPCPDQLDRSAAKTLGYGRGFTLHMGVGHGASAKAPTGHLGMEGDLLRLQTQDFGNG